MIQHAYFFFFMSGKISKFMRNSHTRKSINVFTRMAGLFAAMVFGICCPAAPAAPATPTAPAAPATPAARAAMAPLESVPQSRIDRLAKGANVCRWFRFPPKDTAAFYANYISDGEAAFMRGLGLTHVRLCVAPKFIMEHASGDVLDEHAKFLEAAIQRFHRAGLLVVVDIHNENRKDELDPAWQEAFVRFWKSLAKRLSAFDPEMTIFEVINEPVFEKNESQWTSLNARLVAAIRENAPRHTIITSGPEWGGIGGLLRTKPLADKNVVYSFHCYDPFTFTHQGAEWTNTEVVHLHDVPYPSSPEAVAPLLAGLEAHPAAKSMLADYGKTRWNREKMEANFKKAIDWGKTNGVPLYCGEFGVYPKAAKPEHRAAWFRDFGQVLQENHIGWAVWGWDEGFGLDRKKVDGMDGKPVVDSTVAKALGL